MQKVVGGWTVARQVTLLAGATVLFTAVFFYATPRLNDVAWQGARSRGAAVSGLASEVRLKESGRIYLSDQVVMRAMLSQLDDRKSVPLVGEPYFTGVTLTKYDHSGASGRWMPPAPPTTISRSNSSTTGTAPRRPEAPLVARTTGSAIRQDIVLEVGTTTAYPAILPASRFSETPLHLRYYRSTNRVERNNADAEPLGRQFRYSFLAPGIRNNRQLPAIAHANVFSSTTEAELSALVEFDAERFPRLQEIAAKVLRDQGLAEETQLARARRWSGTFARRTCIRILSS
jgi:hypothetical protein